MRLLTFVDVADAEPGQFSVTARHEAVLADGRRVVLLDDRGWSSSGGWEHVSVSEIQTTARVVVGPDEPFEGMSYDDMEAGHWHTLAETFRAQGVEVGADKLKALPHDVELSERVLARVGLRGV